MITSPFPRMAAAIFVTTLAITPPTSHAPAMPPLAPATLHLAVASAAPLHTQLAPETPGCASTGLAGRIQTPRAVAEWRLSAGPKQQGLRPKLDNPVAAPQTLRPAVHMCVVEGFDPRDMGGSRRAVYHL